MSLKYLYNNLLKEFNLSQIYRIAKMYHIFNIQLIVQFVPVVSKGKFTGKYLVKIIVKQGDPRQLYCFVQKLQLQSANEKKLD